MNKKYVLESTNYKVCMNFLLSKKGVSAQNII